MNKSVHPQTKQITKQISYNDKSVYCVTLTHLEAPLVHTWRSSVVVSVLGVVGITLLVVLMARRGRSSVTLRRSDSLHV